MRGNRTTRIRLWQVVLCGILCWGTIASAAGQQLPTLSEVTQWGLSTSRGKIPAYFSEEFRSRIDEVRPLAEEMLTFYEQELSLQDSFKIVMLSKAQWQQHMAGFPYGLLLVMNHLAFIPATPDGVLNQGTLALRGGVSAATLQKISRSGYTFQTGAEKYTDLILLHELGHSLTKQFGISTLGNQLLTEFTASYFAYTFLAKKHPPLAMLFEAMVTDVYLDAYQPRYTSWADFERLFLQVGPDNYSWYQAQLLKKGIEVYTHQQVGFLKAMRKAFPIESAGKLPNEAILDKLIALDAAFAGWKKGISSGRR